MGFQEAGAFLSKQFADSEPRKDELLTGLQLLIHLEKTCGCWPINDEVERGSRWWLNAIRDLRECCKSEDATVAIFTASCIFAEDWRPLIDLCYADESNLTMRTTSSAFYGRGRMIGYFESIAAVYDLPGFAPTFRDRCQNGRYEDFGLWLIRPILKHTPAIHDNRELLGYKSRLSSAISRLIKGPQEPGTNNDYMQYLDRMVSELSCCSYSNLAEAALDELTAKHFLARQPIDRLKILQGSALINRAIPSEQ